MERDSFLSITLRLKDGEEEVLGDEVRGEGFAVMFVVVVTLFLEVFLMGEGGRM